MYLYKLHFSCFLGNLKDPDIVNIYIICVTPLPCLYHLYLWCIPLKVSFFYANDLQKSVSVWFLTSCRNSKIVWWLWNWSYSLWPVTLENMSIQIPLGNVATNFKKTGLKEQTMYAALRKICTNSWHAIQNELMPCNYWDRNWGEAGEVNQLCWSEVYLWELERRRWCAIKS